MSDRGIIGATIGLFIFLYLSVSTLVFVAVVIFGMGTCYAMPDAAICSETVGGVFHFAYWDMWTGLLDPAHWGFGI